MSGTILRFLRKGKVRTLRTVLRVLNLVDFGGRGPCGVQCPSPGFFAASLPCTENVFGYLSTSEVAQGRHIGRWPVTRCRSEDVRAEKVPPSSLQNFMLLCNECSCKAAAAAFAFFCQQHQKFEQRSPPRPL